MRRGATTTTAPATTTTPTTLPSGATALSALVRDLALGEAAGSIDSGSAQSISNQAQQAISDEAAGSPDQSANDLQQIATTIASGLQNGQITQAEGVTLQSDLASLATALGLTAAGFPATDQHAGNGQGDGNKH